MFDMSVTDDTSHLDRSPSNVRAPPNMIFMLVTREVSHLLISWLNDWHSGTTVVGDELRVPIECPSIPRWRSGVHQKGGQVGWHQ